MALTDRCDLHLHSTASDGTDPPADLPRLVAEAGLAGFALTDHDTAAGVDACAAAAADLGLDFLSGIELSADPGPLRPADDTTSRRGTLHLLGYGIAPHAPGLADIERRLLQARAERNPKLVENLQDLGVKITYDEVVAEAGGAIVGRPHVAQVLLRKGYVKSIHEAFARYIGEGAAAYVRKDRLSPEDAIAAIRSAGGLAVLAHPVQLALPEPADLEHAVRKLKAMGLAGLEVRHSDHRQADVRRFEQLAKQYDLLPTGGSDYHGTRKAIALGEVAADREAFDRLREAIAAQASPPADR